VRIGEGPEVRAGPDGAFRAEVALEEGANDVEVEARDALGNSERARSRIDRQTRPPSGSVGVDYR
jgi:hypothetical protein